MPMQLSGTVVSLNYSPKGGIEGALVETKQGVVQLNVPKGADANVLGLSVGARIDEHAELFDDESGAHPVYEAILPSAGGTGFVVGFNHARHGEVNGYHLEDGTFVHTKPDGAVRYKVKVGDCIRAEGPARRGEGTVVIEATKVKKLTTGSRGPRPRRAPR